MADINFNVKWEHLTGELFNRLAIDVTYKALRELVSRIKGLFVLPCYRSVFVAQSNCKYIGHVDFEHTELRNTCAHVFFQYLFVRTQSSLNLFFHQFHCIIKGTNG